MNKEYLYGIIEKIDSGKATKEELGIYNAFMNRLAPGDTEWIQSKLGNEEDVREELWSKLQAGIKSPKPLKTILLSRVWRIAALFLVSLSVGWYFFSDYTFNEKTLSHVQVDQDLLPGGNHATLILANGKRITLSDSKSGVLVSEPDIIIDKNAEGELTYRSTGEKRNSYLLYDTLTTPAGGVYNIKLADGTKVWLNAGTTIRFPERFDRRERKVELIEGEAYFEVIHNDHAPFRVVTPKGLIEDLGTHFNINSYKNDPQEKTTLIEGSIKVKTGEEQLILKPGQQASLGGVGSAIQITNADLEASLAWKEGLFLFNYENLESIMLKISRWYNVKIEYTDPSLKKEVFLGSISRFKNASEVMGMLEETGKIHFQIRSTVIVVSAK